MKTYTTRYQSPLGELTLSGTDDGLGAIYFPVHKHAPEDRKSWQERSEHFEDVSQQLDEYFRGRRRKFDLKLAPQGTPFQLQVWSELQKIPYGTTISYGELAQRIGKPKASRAVGMANGRNPLSIIIPCHRVIGKNGKLTGYGGGLSNKQALVELELGKRLLQP